MSTADQLDTIHDQICNHFNMISNFDARIRDMMQNYTNIFNSLNVLYEQQNNLRTRFRNEQLSNELSRRRPRVSSHNYRYTPWRYTGRQTPLTSTPNITDPLRRLFGSLSDISDNSLFSIHGLSLDVSGVVINDMSSNFFAPVVVRPTDSEIEDATMSVLYDSTIYHQNTDPIDQAPFDDEEVLTCILYCNHIFRPDNIRRWFNNSVLCPLCRHDIRETNVD